MNALYPNMLYGRKVQISQPQPRMRVSSEFARLQSPELVSETNAWMASFFGYKNDIPEGTIYEFGALDGMLLMNQATYDKLEAAQRELLK